MVSLLKVTVLTIASLFALLGAISLSLFALRNAEMPSWSIGLAGIFYVIAYGTMYLDMRKRYSGLSLLSMLWYEGGMLLSLTLILIGSILFIQRWAVVPTWAVAIVSLLFACFVLDLYHDIARTSPSNTNQVKK